MSTLDLEVTQGNRAAAIDLLASLVSLSAPDGVELVAGLLAEVEQLRARCAAAVSYFLPNGDRVGVAFYDDGRQSDKWIAISTALGDSLKATDGKVILFPTADAAFAALNEALAKVNNAG